MALVSNPAAEAGLNLVRPGDNNPNPIQHGSMGQAERAFSATSTFLSGIMAISASQFIGAPLKYVDPKFYESYMAWTKESFAVLMTTITQWWSPTIVRVSGDDSMKGQLYQMEDGTLKCNFPHRLVLMANHQLYTDWLYLWWIAYTNKMHGRIYIILKESLKNMPIMGWMAQFYNFIFLSRKWETDRYRFRRAFTHLSDPKDPMWLLIFPEGTNLSQETRAKSAAWAQKNGLKDMKNQLLPRTTGLQFCLQELRRSTNWLYDATIAYEGVPEGMYGQDIFTLRSSILEGRPPKSVNIYWRRYRISEIPVDSDEAFSRWLNNRWREKDYILEYFNKFNRFPAGNAAEALQAVNGKRSPNHAPFISTEVKGGGWDEFLGIFGPITSAAGALSSVDLTEPASFDALLGTLAQQQQLGLTKLGQSRIASTSQEAIQQALMAAKHANQNLPVSVINDLVRKPPATQEDMKKRLLKANDPSIAKKAAQAPGAKRALPTGTQADIRTAAMKANQAKQRGQGSSGINTGAGLAKLKASSNMPMANVEAMITRPLSTLAVQTAANSVRVAAQQRTKSKGAALPGQSAPTVKPKAPVVSASAKHASASVKKTPASVLGDPRSSRRASIQSTATASTLRKGAAGAPAKNKPAVGSGPVGTQKYTTRKVG